MRLFQFTQRIQCVRMASSVRNLSLLDLRKKKRERSERGLGRGVVAEGKDFWDCRMQTQKDRALAGHGRPGWTAACGRTGAPLLV